MWVIRKSEERGIRNGILGYANYREKHWQRFKEDLRHLIPCSHWEKIRHEENLKGKDRKYLKVLYSDAQPTGVNQYTHPYTWNEYEYRCIRRDRVKTSRMWVINEKVERDIKSGIIGYVYYERKDYEKFKDDLKAKIPCSKWKRVRHEKYVTRKEKEYHSLYYSKTGHQWDSYYIHPFYWSEYEYKCL